jgi:hypothetical protein
MPMSLPHVSNIARLPTLSTNVVKSKGRDPNSPRSPTSRTPEYRGTSSTGVHTKLPNSSLLLSHRSMSHKESLGMITRPVNVRSCSVSSSSAGVCTTLSAARATAAQVNTEAAMAFDAKRSTLRMTRLP